MTEFMYSTLQMAFENWIIVHYVMLLLNTRSGLSESSADTAILDEWKSTLLPVASLLVHISPSGVALYVIRCARSLNSSQSKGLPRLARLLLIFNQISALRARIQV